MQICENGLLTLHWIRKQNDIGFLSEDIRTVTAVYAK